MHEANIIFWKYVAKEFSTYFNDEIIEFGSYDINGSIRKYFPNPKTYIGVDWRPGPGVDVVSLAHQVRFNFKSRAVLSASMLEHDPYWELSLDNMVDHMKLNGIMVLTWGAAQNTEHCLGESPDGNFHSLQVEKVTKHLENRGLFVHTSIYDGDLMMLDNSIKSLSGYLVSSDGYGEHNLIAFNKGYHSIILPEDKI